MKPVTLTTRHLLDEAENDACLLVVDDQTVSASALSERVRNLVDQRPLVQSIYVVAPNLSGDQLQEMLATGLAVSRAQAKSSDEGPRFFILDLRVVEVGVALQALPLFVGYAGTVKAGDWQPIEYSLIEGWLFNLFDTNGALVQAPIGVHFSKSSGRHSNVFLRSSSTLMSTASCGLLAMVALAKTGGVVPRRIFVDTAPLLSVAYSMHHVALVRKLWDLMPPAQSFSSYGGVGGLPRLATGDLVLISASTSGGLAEGLLSKGVQEGMLVTLFFLGQKESALSKGGVLCNLTARTGLLYGYPPLQSYKADECRFCNAGDVLAELEGDQFLIDRRKVKLLRLAGDTQLDEHRRLFEKISRNKIVKARVNQSASRFTRFEFLPSAVLDCGGQLNAEFGRLLSRFVPHPLHFVVLVNLEEGAVRASMKQHGLESVIENTRFITAAEIESLEEPENPRNFLVLFSVLEDHSQARTINAALRAKSRGGNVAYLAALVIAQSARVAEDLRIFLTYGSRGRDTFTFKSASSLLLPYIGKDASPWAKERAYLGALTVEQQELPEISARLDWLSTAAAESDGLFLVGNGGAELTIQPDFVFLPTMAQPELVSQADVLAVVSNVLACARAGKGNVTSVPQRGTPIWGQTSLYQVLLCPSNFHDFNDPVLRASLLRGADEQELNYVLDETSSAEMLALLQAELMAWVHGSGNSLPEFLLALSTRRLRLTHGHATELRTSIASAKLPDYPGVLAEKFLNAQ